MKESAVYLFLIVGGILGHLLMFKSGDIGRWIQRTFFFDLSLGLDNRGEVATGDAGAAAGDAEVKFDAKQQAVVDNIVKERLARVKSQYADYEDLKKFKDEKTRAEAEKNQKDLEEAKKYDEAKKTYEGKIGELSNIVNQKDQTITQMTIDFNLTNEISKQNGYTEEALALLKSQAVLKEGKVFIKGVDKNKQETLLPVEEGVKNFLTERPHLVRGQHKPGSGTGAGSGGTGGTGAGSGQGGADDLIALNKEFLEAMNRGDSKKTAELKQKIKEVTERTRGVRLR